jgi:hypothetical protein
MKIKKIAAVCKARGCATIWDKTDSDGAMRQWIVTGASAYPVECLPYITEQHLATLMDLSAKQAAEIAFKHTDAPEKMCLDDVCDGEILCREEPYSIVYGGRGINVYYAAGEAWFIDFSLLQPIVAGLLCVGIVLPLDHHENLADMLRSTGEAYREHGA